MHTLILLSNVCVNLETGFKTFVSALKTRENNNSESKDK